MNNYVFLMLAIIFICFYILIQMYLHDFKKTKDQCVSEDFSNKLQYSKVKFPKKPPENIYSYFNTPSLCY